MPRFPHLAGVATAALALAAAPVPGPGPTLSHPRMKDSNLLLAHLNQRHGR